MIEAAVMIVIQDGLILSVSRKRDQTKFGLPGGKKESSETHRKAAIRETQEETGIIVKDCVFLFSREEEDGFCSHCFVALEWEGNTQSSEEGIVKWSLVSELVDPMSAFPSFNTVAFDLFRVKFPEIELK